MIVHALYLIVVKPPKRFAETKRQKRTRQRFRSGCRGTRWRRGCFTGSWRRRCSRCCLRRSCPRWASSSTGCCTTGSRDCVLTVSILFHIVHASFFLDFWSIWPDKTDLRDAMNRDAAVLRQAGAAAQKVREVSAGKQAVSRRDHAGRPGGDRHRAVHDEARADGDLHAQSISLQRHDMGPDVRAARAGRRRVDRAGDGARLHGDPAGEAAHHEVDDLRLDEPRFLSSRSTTPSGGR